MGWISSIEPHIFYGVLTFLVLAVLLLRTARHKRAEVFSATGIFTIALLLLGASHFIHEGRLESLGNLLHVLGLMAGGISIVNLISILIYDLLLRPFRAHTPRILRDLLVALAYIGVGLWAMHEHGLTLSGVITTSAILTAVIGFSMQETLGNIAGGLAIQLEKTINVGDWIRIGQNEGRVKEVRWRYVAIETRNWDTVVIPNSQVMKSEVIVLGRRKHEPIQHRMWVYFNVDFRTPPTAVIEAVEDALRSDPIPNVAAEPKPNCITWLYKESYIEYAVRYWLTDLAVDDPTNSAVRVRIYYALKRLGVPMSIPSGKFFLTQEDAARKERHSKEEMEKRIAALRKVELFHTLTDVEVEGLAEKLRYAPFGHGEAMTRQGADAHWLYLITRGSGEVTISSADGGRRTVAVLKAGDFFGEISLMTGVPRTATVTALEDTDCYRLDKEAFHTVLLKRPEIAEHISHVLARRLEELGVMRDQLDSDTAHSKDKAQKDIFARITHFFGLAKGQSAGR